MSFTIMQSLQLGKTNADDGKQQFLLYIVEVLASINYFMSYQKIGE